MNSTIDRILAHADAIASGNVRGVGPGTPQSFTPACVTGDAIRQGDLYLIVTDQVPDDYAKVGRPKNADRQLVPGNTEGAKHCLDSLDGIALWRPRTWDEESLQGPCLVVTEERKVLHPVHGPVTIPPGLTIVCQYQREWDKEQAKERRARD
jgi:hypothetical protein